MPKYTLRSLLLIVTVIAGGLAILRGAYVALTHFELAENVLAVDWLPPSASNVSYYKSYSCTAYEFNIPESDFRSWAWWELKEITGPVEVRRYSFFAKGQHGLRPDPFDDVAVVSNGLYYEARQSNGGGVSVAYDRAATRAFFQSNPR
jgi:hypothetical protein